ncbi:MAG: bifunctional 5,10-methylenetetrahydrofolate dehydrogenase/5,10-methenyltetrahydrofolate cyclohydrolase [Oscillospiraceae bacterium]
MSALILKGAPVAAALNEKTNALVAELAAEGVAPCLAVVRVGENPDDVSYEKGIIKRCAGLAIDVRPTHLPETVEEKTVIETLCKLSADSTVHGILVFLPLPAGIDPEKVKAAIAPEKDVDGVTDASAAAVFAGKRDAFAPCTAQAVMEMLDGYGVELGGRRAAVFGRSMVVGRPAAMLLTARDATVTLCHSKTADPETIAREADVIVCAVGRAGAIGGGYFRPGQTVIDVGINFTAEGKMCGDADFAAAEETVSAVTPVPGGVGAVTTAVLAAHVAQAAKRLSGV